MNYFVPFYSWAHDVGDYDSVKHCQALTELDFSSIPDASTHITSAQELIPGADRPAYCEVRGTVAPKVQFLLRLPSAGWNGKLVELGCGGPCGTTSHVAQCDDPLRRGYACIVSDGGHRVDDSAPMKWAFQRPQEAVEYLVRASHVTALAGRGIVNDYYGRSAHKSYFVGCSAGGIQAMWQAQRFPWDFDGIVAGSPALSLSRIWLNWVWANRALTAADGSSLLTRADLEVVHQAVVRTCDKNDGVEDGLIGDPRACHFDPARLRCSAGKKSGCLTGPQIEAVAKVYNGPATSSGQQIAAPIALRGSELHWLDFFDGSRTRSTAWYTYIKEWFHYSIFDIDLGPNWQPDNVDFDRDYQRLGAMEALEPMWSPDLRRFQAAGRKLLVFSGWSDAIEGVSNTVEYYETAARISGGSAATREFFRLFVVPGMDHCGGGEGASVIDWLGYLEHWVEQNQAPDVIIGARIRTQDLNLDNENDRSELERRSRLPLDPATVEFTRPTYPYPARAEYLGRGDPKHASSFGPVEPLGELPFDRQVSR
jgi:hypothetical protein